MNLINFGTSPRVFLFYANEVSISHFQVAVTSVSKRVFCTTFDMEMSFSCMLIVLQIKLFHMKCCAPGLVLKKKQKATRNNFCHSLFPLGSYNFNYLCFWQGKKIRKLHISKFHTSNIYKFVLCHSKGHFQVGSSRHHSTSLNESMIL